MRKLANIITAEIYLAIMKLATKKSKKEILAGEEISKFGNDLILSWFVFMLLIMILFYGIVWVFQGVISMYQAANV